MAKKYQCTECGAVWTSPFNPMFCNTKGCKSKKFAAVEETQPVVSAPVAPSPVLSPVLPPVPAPVSVSPPVIIPQAPPSSDIVETKKEEPVIVPTIPAVSVQEENAVKNLRWIYRSDDSKRPVRFRPAVDAEGRVYVSASNKLAMFQGEGLKTGTPDWEITLGGTVRCPVIDLDGNIRSHAADGLLYTINPKGEIIGRPLAVGKPLGWTVPVIDETNNIWIALPTGGLTKITPEGVVEKKPFFRTRQRLDSAGLIWKNVYYTGSETGCVLAIDLNGTQGTNRWDEEKGQTGWAINSAIGLLTESTLVVASRDDFLYGFTLDGTEKWKIPMPGQMLGSPVIAPNGNIYIGLAQIRHTGSQTGHCGVFVCVDSVLHQIKWEFPASAPIESTPVLGRNEIVYFGDNDGNIIGVDTQGREQWRSKVDCAVRSSGILLNENLLAFGLDDGTFAVFDIR